MSQLQKTAFLFEKAGLYLHFLLDSFAVSYYLRENVFVFRQLLYFLVANLC